MCLFSRHWNALWSNASYCHLNTWTKAVIVEHMEIVQLPFSNKTNTKINKTKPTKLNPTQTVYETQQEAKVKAMNAAYS